MEETNRLHADVLDAAIRQIAVSEQRVKALKLERSNGDWNRTIYLPAPRFDVVTPNAPPNYDWIKLKDTIFNSFRFNR